jgi:transcriptional regulator GlxA family with amidase domain
MSGKPVHVSIVVMPECDPSIVYGVFDTLWAAGRFWDGATGGVQGAPLFEPRLVGADTGPMRLCTGVSIIPQNAIADVERTDVVFVPNVMVYSAADLRLLDRKVLAWIKRMHAAGAQLYAACGGSLVLAETGLLDGHQATTHWSYAPIFRERFPNVTLHMERILVQTGPRQSVMCSGGASSWQDLALLLIAKHGGTAEAIRMSKLFLYQWHRDGQLPYSSMVQNVNHGDAVILRCQEWLAQNYHRSEIVGELVGKSGLPKRTFDRRFRAATGYSPLAYIQALRVEEAKQVLETTAIPVENIGREVGYEDAASFRRLFRRLTGITPGEYRRAFQPPALLARTDPKQHAADSSYGSRARGPRAGKRSPPPRARRGLDAAE